MPGELDLFCVDVFADRHAGLFVEEGRKVASGDKEMFGDIGSREGLFDLPLNVSDGLPYQEGVAFLFGLVL